MGPEIRVDQSAGTASFDGYALRYGVWYRVGGGSRWGWDEMIVDAAAAPNVRDDVRLLLNHDGVPVARTSSGTMTLESDKVGLRARAPELDLRNPDVATLVSAAERGDLSQMSFAFVVDDERDEWDEEYTQRRIGGFAEIRDVAAVTYPASPTTSFSVTAARSAARGLVAPFDDVEIELARVRADLSAAKYVTKEKDMSVAARVRRISS